MHAIEVLGFKLEVLCIAGREDAAPIVFLHEGLGSVAMWRGFPARVCAATGRAGVVVSRRGYGQSDPIADVRGPSRMQAGVHCGRLHADYMHHEAYNVLPALLSKLALSTPILLGHSDGASIALLYASRFKTTACIAMAPHLFVEDVALSSIEAARLAYETTDLRSKLAKFHADVDCAFWQWNDVWLSDAFRSFDIRAECARITCPLLAIQGFDDAYGTMAQIDFFSKNGLQPNKIEREQLLKLEHCGHSPHKDQAEKTLTAVAQFVTGL
jgi:pimeloyl-ACP methyl ester carboxylesterase